MIGIVRLALRRPYTFIVMALLIMIFGIGAALRTPTDIFPNIIPARMAKKPTVTAAASSGGTHERVAICMSRALLRSSTASFSKFRPSSCACF